MNLTAITEFDEVCKKHFVDSVSIVLLSKLLLHILSIDNIKMLIKLVI